MLKFTSIILVSLILGSGLNLGYGEPEPFDPVKAAEYQTKLDKRSILTAKQQMDVGIEFMDITCNGDKLPMLKLSANQVVCVKPSSVQFLEDRQWGIVHKLNDSGVRKWECSQRFAFDFEDYVSLESAIIKKFRVSVMDISKEWVYWIPVEIKESRHIGHYISTNGKFSQEQFDFIESELSKIPSVKDVIQENGACY